MIFINNIQEANTILRKYEGATVQICMFSLSLKRLALKLELPRAMEIVYVIGAGCEYIQGNFKWNNSNLVVITEISTDSNETITKIVDEKAGFKLITSGGFSLALGQMSEFGTSFENFLKEESR